MKTILAFGDSNTWGLVPGTKSNERFSWESRWTGILQRKSEDVRIIEEGLCGRTTMYEDENRSARNGNQALPMIMETHHPLDAAILMLGTNDCKSIYDLSPETIGEGIRGCLDEMEKFIESQNILLISPILLGDDVWMEDKDPEFGKKSVATSHGLKEVYEKIARERGTAFLAASDHVSANDADSEHMDEEGHLKLAEVLYEKLVEMKVI